MRNTIINKENKRNALAFLIVLIVVFFAPVSLALAATFQVSDAQCCDRVGARIGNDLSNHGSPVWFYTPSSNEDLFDVQLPLGRLSGSSGALNVKLYTGTINGTTKGTLVETSSNVAIGTLPGTTEPDATTFDNLQNLTTFTFSGNTTLSSGVTYMLTLEKISGAGSQTASLYGTSGTADGLQVQEYLNQSDPNTYGNLTNGGSRSSSIIINTTPAPVTPPVCNSFTTSEDFVFSNGTTTLTWNTTGADTVTISNLGTVASAGSSVETITQSTQFVLTATNTGGSCNATSTVNVFGGEILTGGNIGSVLYETVGTLDPPLINYGGNGTPLSAIKVHNDPSLSVGTIRVNVASNFPTAELGWAFRTGFSNYADCYSPIRTVSDWGITSDPNGSIVDFPLVGSECGTDFLDTGGYSLFSVNATNSPESFNTSYVYAPASQADGDRYLKIYSGSPGDTLATDGISLTTDESPQFDKIVEILTPVEQSTLTSNNVNIQVQYVVAPSFDFIDAYTIRYEVFDAVTNSLEYIFERDFAAETAINFTVNETIPLVDGSKIIRASFVDENNFVISNVDEIFFNVNINTYQTFTGLEHPGQNTSDLSQELDCATFDVGCQFQRALIFLFLPDERAFDSLASLNQNISNRIPFSYYFLAKERIESINLDSGSLSNFVVTPSPSMGQITIVNWAEAANAFGGQHVSQINLFLTYAMWIGFLFWVYRRILNIWTPSS